MSRAGQRAGLGRGLASLLGEGMADAPPEAGTLTRVPLDELRPSPLNPRKTFDADALDELAQSISERGLVQPIVARRMGQAYEIIAGERRYRAARQAGLAEVPVLLIEADDGALVEIAIIENVQRSDLNAVEEARGYQALIDRGYAQGELARTLAKSRAHVANTLRLLNLPEPVLAHLEAGRLTAGQARPLIGHDAAEEIALRIVNEGLSARAVERLVQAMRGTGDTPRREQATRPPAPEVVQRVARVFGPGVSVASKGRRGVTLTFADQDALTAILTRLES